jgi:hypothetical protein
LSFQCNKLPLWIEPANLLQYKHRNKHVRYIEKSGLETNYLQHFLKWKQMQSSNIDKDYRVIELHIRKSNEPGSSVGIVSGYGLDDRTIKVRSPVEAKDFSCSLCVQTGSGAHPVSCTMGTGGPFPGAKARPGRDADHLPLSCAEVQNE